MCEITSEIICLCLSFGLGYFDVCSLMSRATMLLTLRKKKGKNLWQRLLLLMSYNGRNAKLKK